MVAGYIGTFQQDFIPNAEWDVVDVTHELRYIGFPTPFSAVWVNVKLERRSEYYVINIFLPVTLLAVLGLLQLAVPVDGGERLSFGLTVLLSLSVYLSAVQSMMPRSSLTTPLVVQYMLGQFMINGIGVILSLSITSLRYGQVIKRPGKKVFHMFGIPLVLRTGESIPTCFCSFKKRENRVESRQSSAVVNVKPDDKQIDIIRFENKNKDDIIIKGTYPLPGGDANAPMYSEGNAEGDESELDPDLKKLLDTLNFTYFFLTLVSSLIITFYVFGSVSNQQ